MDILTEHTDTQTQFLVKLKEDYAAHKMRTSNLIIVVEAGLLWERIAHIRSSSSTAVGEQEGSKEKEPFDTCDRLSKEGGKDTDEEF